jgi:hypothetical protein
LAEQLKTAEVRIQINIYSIFNYYWMFDAKLLKFGIVILN